MMIETKQPMHLKEYLKVTKHEAQIQILFIRAAAGDGCFFTGCGWLGTEIKTNRNKSEIYMDGTSIMRSQKIPWFAPSQAPNFRKAT
jgi:hypothetical protein